MPDHYERLQVHRKARPEVVRAAYRALLRDLGKHPDLGGSDDEARAIIEAYQTLIDRDRRRAYDRLLEAHSAPPPPPPPVVPPALLTWIRATLSDHTPVGSAPFASRFDLVLRGPGLFPALLYVKACSLSQPHGWPLLFTLIRAVRLARSGGWPHVDALLVVATGTDHVDAFLEEASRPRTRASLNRLEVAVCTGPPPRVHVREGRGLPRSLARLRASAGRQ